MDENSLATGVCVFCGGIATSRAWPTNTHRFGELNAEGRIPLIPRPPIRMCAEDVGRYQRAEVTPGWCDGCADDPNHQGWGDAGTVSPCGQDFAFLP
jgi:hypothetical protein